MPCLLVGQGYHPRGMNARVLVQTRNAPLEPVKGPEDRVVGVEDFGENQPHTAKGLPDNEILLGGEVGIVITAPFHAGALRVCPQYEAFLLIPGDVVPEGAVKGVIDQGTP